MEFLRSVIPADPFQMFFLAGVVCLVVAHGMRWQSVEIRLASDRLTDSFAQQVHTLAPFFMFPIIFAGAAGYFICFWPGAHPVRRIITMVFVPTLASFGLWFSVFLHVSSRFSSVLESTARVFSHQSSAMQGMFWKLPQALQFSLVGLLLIAVYVSRLAFGIATLPLALPGKQALQSQDSGSWRRLQMLLCFLVGFTFFPSLLLGAATLGVSLLINSRWLSYVQNPWFGSLASILEAGAIFCVALGVMGPEARQTAWSKIRLPGLRWSFLALTFPVCIDLLISTGQYSVDRAHWAAHDFGRFAPPQFGSYFSVPGIWLIFLFLGAFFEEVIFRGLLQTRFIHRYGLYRGIFLVGIVWAAFHFFSDSSFSHFTDLEVLATLGFRVSISLALSFVLGWITLRSGSVVPAAIAHTVYNILVFSAFGISFEGKSTLRIALWALLAYALFRYWNAPAVTKVGNVALADGLHGGD